VLYHEVLNDSLLTEISSSEVAIKEGHPEVLLVQVEIEQDGRLITLDVGPDVLLADDAPHSLHGAARVFISLVHRMSFVLTDESLEALISFIEVIALSSHRVPQLEVLVLLLLVSTADEPTLALRDGLSEHDEGMEVFGAVVVLVSLLPALRSVNEVEIVTEEDGMLFGITSSKVQELL